MSLPSEYKAKLPTASNFFTETKGKNIQTSEFYPQSLREKKQCPYCLQCMPSNNNSVAKAVFVNRTEFSLKWMYTIPIQDRLFDMDFRTTLHTVQTLAESAKVLFCWSVY